METDYVHALQKPRFSRVPRRAACSRLSVRWKGRKNTRSWQKRERNRTSGVPPPHYTGLPSNLSRTSQFPLFRPTENLNRQSKMTEIIRFCFTKNLTNTFMNSINLCMIWSTHSLSTLFFQRKIQYTTFRTKDGTSFLSFCQDFSIQNTCRHWLVKAVKEQQLRERKI